MVPSECRLRGARAVISISAWEDGEPLRFPGRIALLRLSMSDIHCGGIWDQADVEACVGRGMTEPAEKHVEAALGFARTIGPAPLVVHCTAGVSRSPAVALAIIADRLGAGQEAEALSELFLVAPGAMPNPGIVRISDRLLGREGRLVAAVESRMAEERPLVFDGPW